MGKIQAVRVGGKARIPRGEIERLLGKADERLLALSTIGYGLNAGRKRLRASA